MRVWVGLALVGVVGCAGRQHPSVECTAHGGVPWVLVESPHFRVRSPLSEAVVREEALKLEQRYELVRELLRVKDDVRRRRIEVVLFETTDDVQRFYDREVAGFFTHNPERVVVNRTEQGTLGHEVTHAIASIWLPKLPHWLDEGIASFLENATFDRSNVARYGQLLKMRHMVARMYGVLPIETLWAWEDSYQQTSDESLRYASAWAWVHFLVNAEPTGFDQLVALLREGKKPRAAFDLAFPPARHAELNRRAAEHVTEGTYGVPTLPVKASRAQAVRPMSTAEVHVTRMLASPGKENLEHAKAELDMAKQLDPRSPDVVRFANFEKIDTLIDQAVEQYNAKKPEAALKQVNEALSLWPEDPYASWLKSKIEKELAPKETPAAPAAEATP